MHCHTHRRSSSSPEHTCAPRPGFDMEMVSIVILGIKLTTLTTRSVPIQITPRNSTTSKTSSYNPSRMPDPLTIVAGSLGVAAAAVKAAIALVNLINSITDAPTYVTALKSRAETLAIVLSEVGQLSPIDCARTEPRRRAVDDCDRLLQEIFNRLEPLLVSVEDGRLKVARKKFRKVLKEEDINRDIQSLESSKITLIITLVLTIARKSDGYSNSLSTHSQKLTTDCGGSTTSTSVAAAALATSDPPSLQPLQVTDLVGELKIGFSTILTETIENIVDAANGKISDRKLKGAFRRLADADLNQIQFRWNPNTSTLEKLKEAMNDQRCNTFLKSLRKETYWENEIPNAAPGTCEWIFNDPSYIAWKGATESQALHLHGKPGSGKSFIIKRILQEVSRESEEHSSMEDTPVLHYFCNNRDRPEESAADILQSFIYQSLLRRKNKFSSLVENCSVLENWELSHDSQQTTPPWPVESLWAIFTSILQVVEVKVFFCFIDALDECGEPSAFIARLRRFLELTPGPTVKFLISSRTDKKIQDRLSEYCPHSIQLSPALTQGDIDNVVEAKLEGLSQRLMLDTNDKKDLRMRIVDRADGMFLWATLCLDMLEKAHGLTKEGLYKIIDTLPPDLTPMYDRILDDILSECNDEEVSFIWRLLSWVAWVGRPLSLKELRAALALNLQDTCFQTLQGRMVLNIADEVQRISFLQIVPPDGEPNLSTEPRTPPARADAVIQQIPLSFRVKLIHQSAKDYLISLKTSRELPEFGHAQIAELCITFLKFNDFENFAKRQSFSSGRPREHMKARIERYNLLSYSAVFWSYHLKKVPEPSKHLIALACSFAGASNHVQNWYHTRNFELKGCTGYFDNFPGLHVAARAGVASLIKPLVAMGLELEATDDFGRTALHFADMVHEKDIVQELEECGANTKFQSKVFSVVNLTKLSRSALDADCEAVRRFLNREDVDLKIPDNYGRTPIFYACASGDVAAVEMLLEAGADLSVKDPFGRTPLDVTLDPQTRQLLIKLNTTDVHLIDSEEYQNLNAKRSWTHLGSLICDVCAKHISCYFYRLYTIQLDAIAKTSANFKTSDCTKCCDDNYDICKDCWDSGMRCLGTEGDHFPSMRAFADGLISQVEFTPWIADGCITKILTERYRCIEGQHETKLTRQFEVAKSVWKLSYEHPLYPICLMVAGVLLMVGEYMNRLEIPTLKF
ncbi:hypothetical protein K440DRAFT_661477 [Wilcoxina mikolae CBS 423.85]|nr:hypothetical protein K440DRAFT_661477 [Wilcoxina mikolae CBS 423.85]